MNPAFICWTTVLITASIIITLITAINVKVENTEGNIWNTTKSPGTNILQGPNLGGNFWANLEGTGFSQISNDSDSDGICDLPYNINGSDFDYFPLSNLLSIRGGS